MNNLDIVIQVRNCLKLHRGIPQIYTAKKGGHATGTDLNFNFNIRWKVQVLAWRGFCEAKVLSLELMVHLQLFLTCTTMTPSILFLIDFTIIVHKTHKILQKFTKLLHRNFEGLNLKRGDVKCYCIVCNIYHCTFFFQQVSFFNFCYLHAGIKGDCNIFAQAVTVFKYT